MSDPADWVDIHHHSYFPEIVDLLDRHGIREMAPGVPVPSWTRERALDVMDGAGISASVASVLLPDAALRSPVLDARGLARRTNEQLAALVRDHPGRFGGLASLPLPDLDGALQEIEYGLDVLGLDGVVLSASLADGTFLGDPHLDPLLHELNRRRATVFLHPNPACGSHGGGAAGAAAIPPGVLDFVFDTTRAAVNLLYGGALARFADLRVVLAHAGGTVPYLSLRIDLAKRWIHTDRPQFAARTPQDTRAALGRFYYETAQSASPEVLSLLKEVAGADRILFGTDYPFIKGDAVDSSLGLVDAFAGFTGAERRAVASGTARELIPSLRAAGTR
ncbi:amidohydrolase family protein [Streptomyces sp. NPDC014733]|uniref:amidohydrolase family protein n=1 Tax=Streptomyces sp. NPDC014733 TaxID=3364885 RepID=UPI0036F8EC93